MVGGTLVRRTNAGLAEASPNSRDDDDPRSMALLVVGCYRRGVEKLNSFVAINVVTKAKYYPPAAPSSFYVVQ